MKLHLKQVGDLTHMDAEGTPEEIAAFVALIRPRVEVDMVRHTTDNQGRPVSYTLVAGPCQGGVGSAAFGR